MFLTIPSLLNFLNHRCVLDLSDAFSSCIEVEIFFHLFFINGADFHEQISHSGTPVIQSCK